MDVDTEELTRREHGVYTMDGINITFYAEGEDSKLGVCEIYWEMNQGVIFISILLDRL